ncbi:hypothetical protein A2U01_0104999, partial [Trifolium medium]|nr:hypothetical protein [Trifolium medium]
FVSIPTQCRFNDFSIINVTDPDT